MKAVGETVADYMAEMEARRAAWVACGVCGEKRPRLLEPEAGKVPLCVECDARARADASREAEARWLAGAIDRHIARWAARAGMSGREMEATVAAIPKAIRRAIAAEEEILLSGIIPRRGFGLRGSAGIGKTCAIAALMLGMSRARILATIPTLGRGAFSGWFAWVAWPEQANRLRVLSTREGGIEDAERIMRTLGAVDALVLDDLGMERSKAEDWVASLLDLLVDERYKARRPTWYTTHLSREELVERYGARMFSRLVGDNPTFEIGHASDLRGAE